MVQASLLEMSAISVGDKSPLKSMVLMVVMVLMVKVVPRFPVPALCFRGTSVKMPVKTGVLDALPAVVGLAR